MYISEIFESIQGEGKFTGRPTTFIRLFGCNYANKEYSKDRRCHPCKYCDERESFEGKRTKMHLGLIIDKVNALNNKYVCMTGGEPLIQEETMPLVYELLYNDYIVTIETNGSIPIEQCAYKRSYSYCMDIKLSNSRGVLHPDINCYENLGVLKSQDEVKFVISSRSDYEEAKTILNNYPTKAEIIFSPVNGDIVLAKDIGDWLIEEKYPARIGLQLHRLMKIK